MVTAGAGIHGGDQHKRRRKGRRARCPADGYLAVFERLAQPFQAGTLELRQFIQKQDAVMAQADLARRGLTRAAK